MKSSHELQGYCASLGTDQRLFPPPHPAPLRQTQALISQDTHSSCDAHGLEAWRTTAPKVLGPSAHQHYRNPTFPGATLNPDCKESLWE